MVQANYMNIYWTYYEQIAVFRNFINSELNKGLCRSSRIGESLTDRLTLIKFDIAIFLLKSLSEGRSLF